MLRRHADWFRLLEIGEELRDRARSSIEHTFSASQGMMHRNDVESLAAAVLYCKPKRVFEIGTYRGASAELILLLLPDVQVISVAWVQGEQGSDRYNNDDLSRDEVGELVSPAHRDRYIQLIGDSHKIDPETFVQKHGRMDLVFIDGDHSREGVRLDTDLARAILAPGGAIAWHDANPKRRYLGCRQFLEEDLQQLALATTDDFVGGVALWTEKLERQLRKAAVVA